MENAKQYVKQLYDGVQGQAEQYRELLETEEKFTNCVNEQYARIVQRITDGMADYGGLFEKQMRELGVQNRQTMEDFRKESSAQNGQYIRKLQEEIAQLEKKYCDDMMQILKGYTDNLVKESAVAIAEVQKDNNLKLQELSSHIGSLAQGEEAFVKKAGEENHQTRNLIDQVVELQKEQGEKNWEYLNRHVDKVQGVLKEHNDEMMQKYQDLTVKNAGQYADTMDRYRDVFVEKNAEALARVERDNVETIGQAFQAMKDLSDSVDEFIEASKRTQKDILQLWKEFCSEVEKGNQVQDQTLKEFNEGFEDNIEELSASMKKNFQKHENEMKNIDEKIMEVTEEYRKLFEQVMDNQKEMQSMSEEDMALLRALAEGKEA